MHVSAVESSLRGPMPRWIIPASTDLTVSRLPAMFQRLLSLLRRRRQLHRLRHFRSRAGNQRQRRDVMRAGLSHWSVRGSG